MTSRLVATRGDVAAVWANVARLQAARGEQELSAQSRKVAAQVRSLQSWLRDKERRRLASLPARGWYA